MKPRVECSRHGTKGFILTTAFRSGRDFFTIKSIWNSFQCGISLFTFLLFLVMPVSGQVRIAALSGWHVPLAGPLTSHWSTGVDLGVQFEIPVLDHLSLGNAFRYSRHAYKGDVMPTTSFVLLRETSWKYIAPILASPVPSVIPTFDNSGTEAYDIIAELHYLTEVLPGINVVFSMGGSLSVVRYADIRYYTQEQYKVPTYVPNGVARVVFKPDAYLSHVLSLGARIGVFHRLDVELDGQAFTNYRGRSSFSADVGLGYTFE